jgi:exosome complex component RRP4
MFHIKDREVVVPGQMLGLDVKYESNCYADGSNVYSSVRGIARIDGESVSVLPSKGGYMPKVEDTVVGIVIEENIAGWVVDLDTAYRCFLRKDEVNGPRFGGRGRPSRGVGGRSRERQYDRGDFESRQEVKFSIGDVLSAKILSVDEVYDANLARPWKLMEGLVISVNPKCIPRLIGKKQSMVNMIKEKTGCKVVIGQNGFVWIKGDNTMFVVEAVRKIEREAQVQGLTDRVSVMLSERVKSPPLPHRGLGDVPSPLSGMPLEGKAHIESKETSLL